MPDEKNARDNYEYSLENNNFSLETALFSLPEPREEELSWPNEEIERSAISEYAWSGKLLNHETLSFEEEQDVLRKIKNSLENYRRFIASSPYGAKAITSQAYDIVYNSKFMKERENYLLSEQYKKADRYSKDFSAITGSSFMKENNECDNKVPIQIRSQLSNWFLNNEAVFFGITDIYSKVKEMDEKTQAFLKNGEGNDLIKRRQAWEELYLKDLSSWIIRPSILEKIWEGDNSRERMEKYHNLFLKCSPEEKRVLESNISMKSGEFIEMYKSAKKYRDEYNDNRDFLLNHNFRFIKSMINKYESMLRASYGDMDDLFTAGTIGLLTAMERFDQSKKCRFYTYARWWVRRAINLEVINTRKGFRIPIYSRYKIREIINSQKEYERADNREYSLEDLPSEAMKGLPYWKFQAGYTKVHSLDSTINDDNDPLYSLIVDQKQKMSSEILDEFYRADCVHRAVESLTGREKEVIKLRFGLQDGQERTLEDVGQIYGLTRERVRQIEEKALNKLRSPARKQHIGMTKEDMQG